VTLSGAATGTLTGTGAGNRVSLTFTPTAGTLTLTVSGSVTSAQLELGAFPTSHIPTTTAQVTRAADQCVVSNLADWYRADEFSIFASAVRTQLGSSAIYELERDTGNRVWNRSNFVGTSEQLVVVVGGVNQAVFAPPAALNHRSALAVKANAFAASLNGAAPLIDNSGSIPSGATILRIGASDGGARINGHIESLQYIPRALSDTELQRITA
ncbi:hypothetical protein ACNFCJ_23975, partial [Pseudomonas sp. NY15364]|uniref:hypothetical protein n=1 Tax=Pseudomonas sp. NY15364 TaxID=3400353 RepID=UPI003A858698